MNQESCHKGNHKNSKKQVSSFSKASLKISCTNIIEKKIFEQELIQSMHERKQTKRCIGFFFGYNLFTKSWLKSETLKMYVRREKQEYKQIKAK